MANFFADSFATVFDTSVPDDIAPHFYCPNSMPDLRITHEILSNIIGSINGNSSPGSDGIHPKLLKELSPELCHPLQLIMNNSLQTGTLPSLWTESIVVPIFKKSSRLNPLNYRPVALTSTVCKIMERALASALWEHIEENNLIRPEQFGFRKGHSTVDQLILTYDSISSSLDLGFYTSFYTSIFIYNI